MQPELQTFLEEEYNHITGVCYDANDPMDPTAGYYPYFSDGATYSNNYADHRQIPAYLLEMHSLKSNKQRVLGAYAYLYGILKVVSEKSDSLRTAINADRAARVDPVPIAWDYDSPAPMVEWPIFEYEVVTNPVLGIQQMRCGQVIEVLAIHGIKMERLTDVTPIDVTNYRMESASMNRLREGRPEISPGDVVPENCTRTYGMNDLVVKTDQPLGTLAVALLEPSGESSLFLWGFFSSTLTSHEYPENYIMIPLAEKMLNESAELKEEWESYKLENPSYLNDTDSVLEWFFRRTALYDTEAFVYPIGILYKEPRESLPLEPYDPTVSDADPIIAPEGCGSGAVPRRLSLVLTSIALHSLLRTVLN
ncbi:peptidase M14 carboxypeptidase family protein [Nitzschia inconspicua]|uniref:Peptidase M14 carboxypeptidase family protein n=1 Tax=Nitzschia inconspicua TaxID=303405 RepID=A0A9K3PYT7_9STRA|nr:peptidase M14 carboxypeptidase family protein [Nitzschia inconspicua]